MRASCLIQSVTCTGSYTVLQADIDNNGGGDGDIDNTATADSDQTGPSTDSERTAGPEPCHDLTKFGTLVDGDGDGYADAGETMAYTFTVKNIGNVTLYNVAVTDPKVTVSGGPLASLAVGATDIDHLHRQLHPHPG